MSPSIVVRSPVRSEPLEGKDAVGALFTILFRTLQNLHFVGEYTSEDGREALHFRWRLGDNEVEGTDMMRFDAEGLIEDYAVMVGPLAAALALRDAVWSKLA